MLTAKLVGDATRPGRVYDGRGTGLFLCVGKSGRKTWGQRITFGGQSVELGLGPVAFTILSGARDLALDNMRAVRRDGDPAALKRRAARRAPTFEAAMQEVIALHAPGWRGARTAKVWESSLRRHAAPLLARRVDSITVHDVLSILVTHWQSKHATLTKVRMRISTIMNWAITRGFRMDDPAGRELTAALPKREAPVAHARAVAYTEVGGLLDAVAASDGPISAKLLLRFVAFTACRSGEARGAAWTEIDRDAATWTIPAARTKMNVEHTVALSQQALAVLVEAETTHDGSGLVFPSARAGRPMSDTVPSGLLREIGAGGTVHGLRTSFRTWAAEATDYPREVAEAALGHAVGGRTEVAYLRGAKLMLAKRQRMMAAWGAFVTGEHEAKIVTIRA